MLGDTARRNSFHPVRQYLDGLEWDGIERLDTWLHAYLGAQDPEPDLPDDASQEERRERAGIMRELVQQYGRKTLIGAVRRVREPGCKHDTLLVLQGKQGLGKSTAIKALCPDKAWFTDSLKIGEDKKAIIELTTGCWLIELAELAGMSKRESGTVKGMLAGDRDDARQAYGKFTTRRERQFLCIGTINENEFLQDPTGNRRYWTVSLNNQTDADKVKAELTRDRDQLWAEADYFVRKGEDSTLPKHLWAAAAIEQGQPPDCGSLGRQARNPVSGGGLRAARAHLRNAGDADAPAKPRRNPARVRHTHRHGFRAVPETLARRPARAGVPAPGMSSYFRQTSRCGRASRARGEKLHRRKAPSVTSNRIFSSVRCDRICFRGRYWHGCRGRCHSLVFEGNAMIAQRFLQVSRLERHFQP